jgi:hypothetical protein
MPKRPAKPESVSEVVVLPTGAAELDDALVTKAAKEIATILRNTIARGLHDVGDYLLKNFYDDDPALYHSTSPAKHASLSRLVAQCGKQDLPVNKTFLSNAIRLAVMTRELPESTSLKQLPPEPPDRAAPVGARAREAGYHRRASRREEAHCAESPRRGAQGRREDAEVEQGRKPVPPALRAVHKVTKLLGKDGSQNLAFLKADLSELTGEQRDELRRRSSARARSWRSCRSWSASNCSDVGTVHARAGVSARR